MSLAGLDELLGRSASFERALDAASQSADFAAIEALRPALVAGLVRRRWQQGDRGALLLIAATSREADSLRSSLGSLVPEAVTAEFSAWETLPHERLSPSAETVGRRATALSLLREHDGTRPLILVASVRAALQAVSPHAANATPLVLRAGEMSDGLEHVSRRLVELAYTRVDMVTRRGEFAVRGGILDVFPPTTDQAVRVDFFGDEVDQIRTFAVSDQRSAGDPLPEAQLWPAREMLLTDEVRERAAELLPRFPALGGLLEKISQGIPVEGMESLLPQLLPGLKPITALMPDGGAVVVISPERVASRAVSLAETNREFLEAAWMAATAGADAPVPTDEHGMLSMAELREAAGRRPWQTITGFVADAGDLDAGGPDAGDLDAEADGQLVVEGHPLNLRTPGQTGARPPSPLFASGSPLAGASS